MSSLEQIKIVPEAINEVDADRFMRYIDTNLNKFHQYAFVENPNRFSLMFGKDQVYWHVSNTSLEKIKDIEFLVRDYFNKLTLEVEKLYNHPTKLYVTSFWLARQFKDSRVDPHFDSGEVNQHFKYSIVLYLNDLDEGGELEFPRLEYTYKPKGREMIVFPSQGEDFLHEVKAIGGDRYSLVYWLTDNPYMAI